MIFERDSNCKGYFKNLLQVRTSKFKSKIRPGYFSIAVCMICSDSWPPALSGPAPVTTLLSRSSRL